jgi:hypothetical protein
VTRGSVAKTPYFPKTISCLVVIMSGSGDSGHNSGLDGSGLSGGFVRRIRVGSIVLFGAISPYPLGPENGPLSERSQDYVVVGVCLSGVDELGGCDGDALGTGGGAKRRAKAMAVLLSLTFARIPGSTLR